MKSKRYLYLVLILLAFIISISAASAADDTVNNIISANANNEITLDESISDDVSTDNDELILDESDQTVLEDSEEKTTLKDGSSAGTFTDLNKLINEDYAENTTIYLSNNYTYDSATASDENYRSGIKITHDLTIYGNNNRWITQGKNIPNRLSSQSSYIQEHKLHKRKRNSHTRFLSYLWRSNL